MDINNLNKYDPFLLNDFFITEHPDLKIISKRSKWYLFASLIWKLLRHIASLIAKTKITDVSISSLKEKYEGGYIILSLTNNNRNAVASIKDKLESNNIKYKEITSLMDNTQFPSWSCLLKSLKCLPIFWRRLMTESVDNQCVISHYYLTYLLSYGYVDCFKEIINNNNIQGVLFSNDHIGANRALEYLCKDLNIPSLYIQHASVSEYYPELEFSYSFLDGMDSFNKYISNKNVYSIPVVFGAIRYAPLKQMRKTQKEKNNAIGIAVNVIDSEEKVQSLCDMVTKELPAVKMIIRAHPNLRKKPFHIKGVNVEYTSALDEPITDFFKRIDVLVSNDSTIHLDAIEFGLSSIKYNLSAEGFSDQYSYVERGLIKNCETPEDLLALLRNPQSAKSAPAVVQYYDHSYMQDYELQLNEILTEFIINKFSVNILEKYGFHIEESTNKVKYYIYR